MRINGYFKTKHDLNGKIKWHKTRFITKIYTQKDCIDRKKGFLSVLKVDLLRIIIFLVAHYNLELR